MNRRALKYVMTALVAAIFFAPALKAQEMVHAAVSSDAPLEISADGTLEWDRDNKIFKAVKNASAQQGDVSIAAAALSARYRDGAKGGMEIYEMTATDNVVIHSRDSDAHGDHAVYELDKSLAVMTGADLRLTSPDQTLTARDKFEYWVAEGKLVAIGDAKLVRKNAKGETDTLEADTIAAVMKNNAQGQRVLDTLQADGNVVITTPTEILRGNHGIYRSSDNTAEITGRVKITRGPNILEGTKAQVNLTTNVSRIFGGTGPKGRVRGVFYPDSEKKKEK